MTYGDILKEGKLAELLERYKTLGFIDDATLQEIYNIAVKYIKNLKGKIKVNGYDEEIEKICDKNYLYNIIKEIYYLRKELKVKNKQNTTKSPIESKENDKHNSTNKGTYSQNKYNNYTSHILNVNTDYSNSNNKSTNENNLEKNNLIQGVLLKSLSICYYINSR